MKRKDPDPHCILCRGSGVHAPITAGPARDPVEEKRWRASLPDQVECGCTFIWETPST